MIKTMLLTAQLALSPIVGTNGLQPKRLPNPVYGESVNMSVTYEGKNYHRVMYGKDSAYYRVNVAVDGDLYIGWNSDEEANLTGDFTTESVHNGNVGGGQDYYLYWVREGSNSTLTPQEVYLDDYGNFCFSFWTRQTDANVFTYYEYFLSRDEYATETKLIVTAFDINQTLRYQDNTLGWDDIFIPNNYSFFFYWENETDNLNWNGKAPTIQKEQPAIANPSVYDNIYNFYYQNLFANEALDELGAEIGNNSLTMRQWLAHTATIISISLLSAALVILVIKIFKLIAGSISDIWG